MDAYMASAHMVLSPGVDPDLLDTDVLLSQMDNNILKTGEHFVFWWIGLT